MRTRSWIFSSHTVFVCFKFCSTSHRNTDLSFLCQSRESRYLLRLRNSFRKIQDRYRPYRATARRCDSRIARANSSTERIFHSQRGRRPRRMKTNQAPTMVARSRTTHLLRLTMSRPFCRYVLGRCRPILWTNGSKGKPTKSCQSLLPLRSCSISVSSSGPRFR
jgi:hypothetical protein